MKAMISRCMLGIECRYDAKSKPLDKEILDKLHQKYTLIPNTLLSLFVQKK